VDPRARRGLRKHRCSWVVDELMTQAPRRIGGGPDTACGNYGLDYAARVELRFCDETEHGFSWIVDEPMTRTSHALAAGGKLWLVDPVDWPQAIERAVALGQPAAVLQLLDRHNRDCAAVAGRLGVPHLVAPRSVPGSPFDVVELRRWRRWHEVALWWPETRTLVVAEAVGTNTFFPVGNDRAGVHRSSSTAPDTDSGAGAPGGAGRAHHPQ